MSKEQRIYPRIPMEEDTIYFSVISMGQPQPDGNNEVDRIHYPGTITNLSRGGLGMRVNVAHKQDDEIWLEGLDGTTAPQSGRVKWVCPADTQEQFNIGVQLTRAI